MKKEQLIEIKKGQTGTGLLVENDGYIDINSKENKMIKESIESFREEGKVLPNPLRFKALMQRADAVNANGRIYPKNILMREADKYQDKIANRISVGEMEHPDSSNVNGERVCLLVTELHWVGDTLVGEIELPITDGFRRFGICSNLADTLANLLINNIRIGVSSRSLGSVETRSDGILMVQDDLEIIGWDAVTTPSTFYALITKDDEELNNLIAKGEKKAAGLFESKEDKFSKFENWLKD